MAFSHFRPRHLNLSLSFSALALAAVTLLTVGCHPPAAVVPPPPPANPNDPTFVVAETGSISITRAELNKEVDDYLKQHRATREQVGAKMPLLETAMLDNLILKKLLLQKAATMQLKDLDKEEADQLDTLKARIPPGQDFDAQLKTAGLSLDALKQLIHEKVEIGHVLKDAIKPTEPTDQEINDVYVQHQSAFNIPPKVRASRVLVLVDDKITPADLAAKKKKIAAARARVMKGEEFSKVATEVSEDRYSAPRGGDLGFFPRNENEPGFDEVAFATKQNTVSPIFQTSLGLQFIKVTAIQPGGIVPIADARQYITGKLKEQKTAEAEDAYTKKVLADAHVTYHVTRNVPPPPSAATNAPPEPPAPENAPPPPPAPEVPAPAAAPTNMPPAPTK